MTAPRFSVVLLPTDVEGGDTRTVASLERQGFPTFELLRVTAADTPSIQRTVRGARRLPSRRSIHSASTSIGRCSHHKPIQGESLPEASRPRPTSISAV